MANHKRRRPKHQRAGCLCCKPHKDERAAQSAPPVTEHADSRPPGKRRKGRRRWCRGVVGTEHRPAWVDERSVRGHLTYRCQACGKVLDSEGPGLWRTDRGERYRALLAEHGFPRAYVSRWTGKLEEP